MGWMDDDKLKLHRGAQNVGRKRFLPSHCHFCEEFLIFTDSKEQVMAAFCKDLYF